MAQVQPLATIALPPLHDSGLALESALRQRRTVRDFSTRQVTLAQLGQLLWAAQGVTGPDGKRNAPSAGAMHPLSLYAALGQVEGCAAALTRYDPQEHRLETLAAGDLRAELAEAAIDEQPWLAAAPLVLAMAAKAADVIEHFAEQPPQGERGLRYLCMEVGHSAQNVYLQCAAIGLAGVFVGGFHDDAVAKLLQLPSDERPFGLMAIGHTAT